MLTPKSTCWHSKGSLSREMSGITFCVYSTSCFYRHILVAVWKVLSLKPESALWLVPCRNEDRHNLECWVSDGESPTYQSCVARPVQRGRLITRIGISSQSGEWTQQEKIWPSRRKPVVLAQMPKLEVPKCIDRRWSTWLQGNLGRKT